MSKFRSIHSIRGALNIGFKDFKNKNSVLSELYYGCQYICALQDLGQEPDGTRAESPTGNRYMNICCNWILWYMHT